MPAAGVRPGGAVVPEPAPGAPPPGTPLGSHYRHCFGCGPDHPTGLHLQMRAGDGVTVTAELTVTDDHQGAPSLAHGGLLAAALDEALGGLMHRLRRPAVTARLVTEFLAPVPVGSRLVITARCTGVEGRKVYGEAEGRLDGPDGPVVVRAESLFVIVGVEHFERYQPEGRRGGTRPDLPEADSGATWNP